MNAAHTLASLENLAFSLMGRLHVALRRQTGRVTDIEYMRLDPAYCRHVLDMAAKTANEDVAQICTKLEEIYFGVEGLFVRPAPRQPLLARLTTPTAPAAPAVAVAPVSVAPPAVAEPAPEMQTDPAAPLDHGALVDQTYIGRLR
jgi:hypothetical protein